MARFAMRLMLGVALSVSASLAMCQTMPPPDAPSAAKLKQTPSESRDQIAQHDQVPQKDAKPEQSEDASPVAPSNSGSTLDEIEAGIRTEPPCRAEKYPCELTTRSKFRMFEKRSYSPFVFLSAGFDAGYSQITGDNYGTGMASVAKRYGANLADGESRSFFQTFLFSSLFRQDPRYHRLGEGPLLARASYAASRVLIGREDDGHCAFNWPELFGVAATVTLGNAYYPDRDRGVGRTINHGVGSFGSDATTNLLREFWPDIRRVLRRHEPRRVQQMDSKWTARFSPRPRAGDASAGADSLGNQQ